MGLGARRRSVETDAVASSLIAGRYRVESTLGRGAAGAVLSVFDTSEQRRVALKQLTAGASQRVLTLFEQEYYTLAGLSHPGIVEVYEYGNGSEGPYYTMELLSGADLSAMAPLPFEQACQIVADAASALSVLHARRLVHRDISPRNVWRCEDGRIKLIDFGALAPFGNARDVVGTPPLVAPEAVHGQALDQRTDLYALGALLYWMLTGNHAYPVRNLRDLPERWARGFIPLSKALSDADQAAIPSDLDALIESLLSQNPLARPSSTGELIDRLRANASLTSQVRAERQEATLPGTLLVGREREREVFRKALAQLQKSQARPTLLEGDAGSGRTRLLRELSLEARLSGACTLYIEAGLCDGPLGVANALANKVMDAAPEIARELAQPHAGTLANLSVGLAARLNVKPSELPGGAGEARARMQEALDGWLIEISRRVPLAIMIDDLERADEASQALLLTLIQRIEGARILFWATLSRAFDASRNAPVRALRQGMRRVILHPLDSSQTRALVASMFGDVPHATRLAERLFRAAEGSPARIVALADQLVRAGSVSQVDGTWMLPHEVPAAQLVYDRAASLAARLARLPHEAHALGRGLSVYGGFIPPEMLKAVSDLSPKALFEGLEALVREEILIGDAGGYRFREEQNRSTLHAALDEREKKRAHARVGAFLLGASQLKPADELAAHVHLLQGDDFAKGEADKSAGRVAQVTAALMLEDPDSLRAVTPAIEQALTLFRARKKTGHQLICLLSALVVAGYFIDRNLAVRYGDEALATLTRVLGLDLARKLRPWLGKRLSLIIGLARGGVGFALRKKDPCVPPFPDAIRMFFNCAGALSGVAAVCVDPEACKRYVALTEIWTGLGPKHFASIIHEVNLAMLATMQDRQGDARRRWQQVLVRLESKERAAGMPEDARIRYLAGALYAAGVLECFRDGASALEFAHRLDQIGMNVCKMTADQVRSLYYAHQGNQELFERYRERVELAAVQFGSAWQVEVWSPGAANTVCQRTHDAMGVKQAWEQVRRIGEMIPSQALLAERVHGAHLVMRRRYAEAVVVLEKCMTEPPLEVIGWGRAHGTLARALNALGQHQRAQEACARALGALSPEDLAFPAFFLGLQIEQAMSETGLGNPQKAAQILDALLVQHEPNQGPLTLGALHEARARVALAMGDVESVTLHQRRTESYYRGTRIPSLTARCETLARELRRRLDGQGRSRGIDSITPPSASALTSHALTDVVSFERLLSALPPSDERARKALEYLLSGSSAQGAIWLTPGNGVRMLAESDNIQLLDSMSQWVQQRATEEVAIESTQTADLDSTMLGDPNVLETQGMFCRLYWLRLPEANAPEPVGALVLAHPEGDRLAPSIELLDALARHLSHIAEAAA